MDRRTFLKSFAVIGAAAAIPLPDLISMQELPSRYIVMEELMLTEFGNRIPSFEFEVELDQGMARTALPFVWVDNIKEWLKVWKISPAVTRSTYMYSVSAVLFCDVPMKGIRRIWADGKELCAEHRNCFHTSQDPQMT